MNLFQEVKERVPVSAAAERYGFHPNRAGFICCPFHDEKTPSLKLYPGTGGFHCFGCQVGGSVIDFTMRLFDLSPLEAVKKLNNDFFLALPLDRPPTAAAVRAAQKRQETQETRRAFDQWRNRMTDRLTACIYTANHALFQKPESEWTAQEVEAIKWQAALEYWCDLLIEGNLARMIELFRDRKGVEQRCKMILNGMQTKFETDY